MKNKFIPIILSLAVIIAALSGCNSNTAASNETVSPVTDTASETNTESEQEAEPEAEETVEEVDAEPEVTFSADDAKAMYEAFLKGDAKASVYSDIEVNPEGYMTFSQSIADGTECTLDDLHKAFKESICDRFEDTIEDLESYDFTDENAYIDCGNDGMPELLVSSKIYFVMDEYTAFMIFKAGEDGIKMCFCDCANSRSSMSVNEFGYIRFDASGGAAYHLFENRYIDGDGNYHFLYGNSHNDDLATMDIYADEELIEVPKKYKEDFKDVVLIGFYTTDEKEEFGGYTYSYSLLGEYDENDVEPYSYCILSRDPEIYDPKSVYMKAFEEMGIEVVPLTDIDKKADEIERSNGVDEAIKSGKIVMEVVGE
ncbi:MAG: hypothetical protein K6A38_02860 [Lachnospiraceae bacterium]|nr:hypothetical protein [Lachnospiraceae bacterium]